LALIAVFRLPKSLQWLESKGFPEKPLCPYSSVPVRDFHPASCALRAKSMSLYSVVHH